MRAFCNTCSDFHMEKTDLDAQRVKTFILNILSGKISRPFISCSKRAKKWSYCNKCPAETNSKIGRKLILENLLKWNRHTLHWLNTFWELFQFILPWQVILTRHKICLHSAKLQYIQLQGNFASSSSFTTAIQILYKTLVPYVKIHLSISILLPVKT